MIFLDSNIVIDLIENAEEWLDWSFRQVALARGTYELVTSPVVIAETASHFASLADQSSYLTDLGIAVQPLGSVAARRAGLAHYDYRRAGGKRVGVLADFLIGGHAVALGATLLTRDRQRFASYFPELTLITPDTHP